MISCKRCGSGAINPHCHGRDDTDLDLCDVCYWRKQAADVLTDIAELVDTTAHVNKQVYQKCRAMLERLERR